MQTEVITVSDTQLLMCSCYTEQTDAGENSISNFSVTVFHKCIGEKKIFSLLKQIISERERGANNYNLLLIILPKIVTGQVN